MKRLILRSVLVLALICFSFASPAFADHRGGGHWGGHGGGHSGWSGGHSGWGGGHHYYGHDYRGWHEGYWHHGWHGDRWAWWWVTGALWYPYSVPVYPYPDPYTPQVIIQQSAPEPQVQVQPQASMWYYCDSPAGYYPYVPECRRGWRAVPATPPTGNAAVPPPPSRY